MRVQGHLMGTATRPYRLHKLGLRYRQTLTWWTGSHCMTSWNKGISVLALIYNTNNYQYEEFLEFGQSFEFTDSAKHDLVPKISTFGKISENYYYCLSDLELPVSFSEFTFQFCTEHCSKWKVEWYNELSWSNGKSQQSFSMSTIHLKLTIGSLQ